VADQAGLGVIAFALSGITALVAMIAVMSVAMNMGPP
jgi:hypothetical protein